METLPLKIQLMIIDEAIKILPSDLGLCSAIDTAFNKLMFHSELSIGMCLNNFRHSLIKDGVSEIYARNHAGKKSIPLFNFEEATTFRISRNHIYKNSSLGWFWFRPGELQIRLDFLEYLKEKIKQQMG